MLFKRKEVEDEEHLESEADESDSGQDYSVLNSFRELESRIKELEEIVMYKLIRAQHCKDGWFIREVVKVFAIADLIALKHEYRRRMRHLPRSPFASGSIKQDRIDRAKEYPILDIAQISLQDVKKCGRTYRSLCPYHQEETPSFFLYPQTNTFHCFGCQKHGDVIALTQKLLLIGFVNAVKHLTPTYES